jgi:predicted negative regulator of RcsB-dependent stress response
VGTTKLTRKEILAEDPVHEAIIRVVDLFREHGRTIAIGAAIVVLIASGVYFLRQYLDRREAQAQQQLAKGIDFFHAQIDPSALDDPYGKGLNPTFRTEAAKYQAASKELQEVASGYSFSKTAVIARFYLGLIQLRDGNPKEAVKSLESVANNTKDRTVGYLAKKALAGYDIESGNYKGAKEILDGIIRDPQCELPKEDLYMQLAQVLQAQGKHDEALKVLRDAREKAAGSMMQMQIVQELTRLESTPGGSPGAQKPAAARP